MIWDRRMVGIVAGAVGLGWAFGPALAQQYAPVEKPVPPDYIVKALAHAGRLYTDYERDYLTKYPELYAFAQIKPGDKVVELYPADGSNLKQIAHIIGPTGHFYGITLLRDIDQAWELRDAQEQSKTGWHPIMIDMALANENVTEYGHVTQIWTAANQFGGNIALPEQVDVVFTDHYHDMHDQHTGNLDMVAVNKSLYQDTKPGGVYLVADSISAPGTGMSVASTLHRTEPKALIAEVTAGGWALEAEDDTWRRYDDPHTGTAQCQNCRDKSDRIAFRFRKPATAPDTDMRPKGADPMADYYGNTLITDMGYRDIHPGAPYRHRMYHTDGTFWEYGFNELGDHSTKTAHDPVPLRMGTWFWDAAGHNCMRIEYPARERGLTLCNNYIVPREFNKIYEVNVRSYAGPAGAKEGSGHVILVKGEDFLDNAINAVGHPDPTKMGEGVPPQQ